MAGGVFINYRRALNLRDAQLLQKALQRHFGQRGVFLDVSGLDGGDHWLHALEKQVDASAAMVALMGRGWADVRDEKGNRRLDNPNDFVRFELARAFSRSMPVLPVLLDGAEVPDVAQLPTNLLPLTFLQAMPLRGDTFDDDADKIARRLRYLVTQSRRTGLSYQSAGAGVMVALVLGVATGPILSRLGVPVPGLVRPEDERLRTELDAARAALGKAVRERDVVQADLGASQRQVDAANTAAAQSATALAAATKARDEAHAEANSAKADADEWRQKHAALDIQTRKLLAEFDAARGALAKAVRELDGLRADLATSQKQVDAATKARDGALAQGRSAKAEAEEWRKKYEASRKPTPEVTEFSSKRAAAPLTAVEEQALKPKDSFRECPLCPEMVVVPDGTFEMGSPDSPGEEGRDTDEGPRHWVTIARPFAVGKFEVTFAEWDACVADRGCSHRPHDGKSGQAGWGRSTQPVIHVSWNDITNEYLPWLRGKTGKTYRLLSEAEWEYVARAGTTTPFWWGSSIATDQANYDGNDTYGGGPKGQYREKTVPVDSFKANPWGLYNVHGNVWELVLDCWNDSYNGAPSDGSAWTAGDCSRRVMRGGSWVYGPKVLRAANRGSDGPAERNLNLGFRVGRTF